jgi:GNAT superfamily N-acetyltransferase
VKSPIDILQLTRDECHRQLNSLIAISAEETGFAWTAEHLLHDMPDKWTLSAIARDAQRRVVGFQITSRAPGHPHLHRIMVTDAQRSAGVGARLMAWLCRTCVTRNWAPLTLKVHASNYGAVRFYERLSFTMHETGRIDTGLNAPLLEAIADPAAVLRILEEKDLAE